MTRAVPVLLSSLLLAPSALASSRGGTGGSAPRNVVQRIDVDTEPGAAVITIALRSPPTFTTRAVVAPRSFVIDLPETTFARFSPVITAGSGLLARVESRVALREGVQVARIALVLAEEAEPPQVTTRGSTLRVRIPGATRPPTAKAQEPVVPSRSPPPAEPPASAAVVVDAAPEPGKVPATTADALEATAAETPAAETTGAPEPVDAKAREPGPPAPIASAPVVVAVPRAPPPDPRRIVREVVFRPLPGRSAVVVRLSGPPRFEVLDGEDRRVTIDLPNTGLERRNDARPLDTSFFPGPVASIVSRRSGSATRIVIALKRNASPRARVDGDTLVLEFDHPGEP